MLTAGVRSVARQTLVATFGTGVVGLVFGLDRRGRHPPDCWRAGQQASFSYRYNRTACCIRSAWPTTLNSTLTALAPWDRYAARLRPCSAAPGRVQGIKVRLRGALQVAVRWPDQNRVTATLDTPSRKFGHSQL